VAQPPTSLASIISRLRSAVSAVSRNYALSLPDERPEIVTDGHYRNGRSILLARPHRSLRKLSRGIARYDWWSDPQEVICPV